MITTAETTRMLTAVTSGDRSHIGRLMRIVYDELRNLAKKYLRRQKPDHTLEPTALVHEAFLKLVNNDHLDWKDRSHFYAICAQAMRRILVDHARANLRQKRGGSRQRISLNEELTTLSNSRAPDVIAVDDALNKLEELHPDQARIVEMRFFSGMTVDEVAEALGMSKRTVERHWTAIRAVAAPRAGARGRRVNYDRHREVMSLFLRAVELDGARQASFLSEECGSDTNLRQEVESLLIHHHPDTILVDQPQVPTQSGFVRPPNIQRKGLPRSRLFLSLTPLQAVVAAVILALGVGFLSWWTYQGIRRSIRSSLRDQLTTILDADVKALEHWVTLQKATLRAWAADPEIQTLVEALVEIRNTSSDLKNDLLASDAYLELINLLEPVYHREGSFGISVLSLDGVSLANLKVHIVGSSVSKRALGYMDRLRDGETILARPTSRDTYVVGFEDKIDNPVMGVATPVRNAKDEMIGILAFGFDADDEFTKILSTARLGRTGETYAFDARGYLLSNLRNSNELKDLKLVPNNPGSRAALNLQIRDPGGDMRAGFRPKIPRDEQPLTRMAKSAINEKPRRQIDMDGYANYQGTQVVGAWTWIEDDEFGVAAEIEVNEIYAPLNYITSALWLLFGGLALFLGTTALYSGLSIRHLRGQVQEAAMLGQYQIEKLIGQGGMGKVYLARHAMLKRPTAIKLLDGKDADSRTVARFEREVQLTSQLTHPNTIQIYDYGRTPNDIFYYAMEYLPGLTLAQLVESSGAVATGRVVFILRQACASLHDAHENNIIHRDVKPANVMICERGGFYDFVKVLDFGLAKNVSSDRGPDITQADQIGGTPLYIAPERVLTPTNVDVRSDLYSVGALAFYLLTGRSMFQGGNIKEILRNMIQSDVPRPSSLVDHEISPELDQLVVDCLQKNPEERPRSAAALIERLDSLPPDHVWTQADARNWWLNWQGDGVSKNRIGQPEQLLLGSPERSDGKGSTPS